MLRFLQCFASSEACGRPSRAACSCLRMGSPALGYMRSWPSLVAIVQRLVAVLEDAELLRSLARLLHHPTRCNRLQVQFALTVGVPPRQSSLRARGVEDEPLATI